MELTTEQKKLVISEQITGWVTAKYSLQLQHRVQAGLENKQGMADIEKRLLDCEKALDILQAELEKPE